MQAQALALAEARADAATDNGAAGGGEWVRRPALSSSSDASRRPVRSMNGCGDWKEVYLPAIRVQQIREQGARCMDCGIPFCHQEAARSAT